METVAVAPFEARHDKTLYRILNRVERVGNLVPNPTMLFVGLAAIVVLASAIVSSLEITVPHQATGETIRSVTRCSPESRRKPRTSLTRSRNWNADGANAAVFNHVLCRLDAVFNRLVLHRSAFGTGRGDFLSSARQINIIFEITQNRRN